MKKLYVLGFSMATALAVNAQNLYWPKPDAKLVGDAAETIAPPAGPAGSWRVDLTPDAQFVHGGVWRSTPVNMAASFKLVALMNFGTRNESASIVPADPRTGADGMAFVIHNIAPVAKSVGSEGAPIGGYGQKLGYATGARMGVMYDFPQQFAVEFDSWWNPQENDSTYLTGPNAYLNGPNHIAFMKNGNANHNQGSWAVAQGIPFILEDGQDKRVTIHYLYIDATHQAMVVNIQQASNPAMFAQYIYNGNILADIGGAGPYYVGFTGATGESTNRHQVEIQYADPCQQTNPQVPGFTARGGQEPQQVLDEQLMTAPEQISLKASVFPNPSKGQVQLRVANTKSDRVDVSVVNSKGVVLERIVTSPSQVVSFDLKKYGVGVYMVKVISGTSVQTERVVVME